MTVQTPRESATDDLVTGKVTEITGQKPEDAAGKEGSKKDGAKKEAAKKEPAKKEAGAKK